MSHYDVPAEHRCRAWRALEKAPVSMRGVSADWRMSGSDRTDHFRIGPPSHSSARSRSLPPAHPGVCCCCLFVGPPIPPGGDAFVGVFLRAGEGGPMPCRALALACRPLFPIAMS